MSAYHATKKHIFILLGKTDILNLLEKYEISHEQAQAKFCR